MTHRLASILSLLLVLSSPTFAAAPATQPAPSPSAILRQAIASATAIIEPSPNSPQRTFSANFRVTRADGLPKELAAATGRLAYQAPDHLLLTATVSGRSYTACRDGQDLWAYVPDKHFAVVGVPGQPWFADAPQVRDQTVLPPFTLPLGPKELQLLTVLPRMDARPDETLDGQLCHVITMTSRAYMPAAISFPGSIELALRQTDLTPLRIGFDDGQRIHVELCLDHATNTAPWPAEAWKLKPAPSDTVQKTAIGHLSKCLTISADTLTHMDRPLPGPTGKTRLIATAGDGRLEDWDGTRVLFVKGTPAEMGRQQGELLGLQIHRVSDRMLWGVGMAISFEKGTWFFNEIADAQRRLDPFIPKRHAKELDAMADAAGMMRTEARLANIFPELFHCSGFALCGQATVGGKLYHGRILDYMRGVGLEANAVVAIVQPDEGNAWANIGYAGFIGSVTAMNEKHIAIGEMGGGGQGKWDGVPMAQLVRLVMERASTLDEAVDLMRKSPRTCNYYYVISDGKDNRAVGIHASPDVFEVVALGQPHPQLPHAIKDAVVLSAGKRYETLTQRVEQQYGKINAAAARALMDPPVCMSSNIQSVLFEPATLDFWVANADGKNVASRSRYTHYNLGDMLKPRK